MNNPMFDLMDSISISAAGSYTYLKNFREMDYQNIDFDTRLKQIEIPNLVKYNGCHPITKLDNQIELTSFSNYEMYQFDWSLFNDETEVWEDLSFTSNIPVLQDGLYFNIKGSKYFLVLSLADRGTIHSKQKVIYKNYNDMFVLQLDGIPGFNFSGKKVNMMLVLLYKMLIDGYSLEALLEMVFKKHDIVGKDDVRTKTSKHIKFKDFAILVSKYPTKYEMLFFKALEKLKTMSASEFNDIEAITKRIKSVYSTPTSKKAFALLDDSISVLNGYENMEAILEQIRLNVAGEYNSTQLETVPQFADLVVDTIYTELRTTKKIFLSRANQSYDNLKRMFNKNLLQNIVISRLFTNKLLQYNDLTNLFDTSLKVSLTHSSGRAVSNDTRNITEDYYENLSLHFNSTGKQAGLTTFIAPV